MKQCEIEYKLWIFDVDGTLTDSGIYYDNNGNELKKFSTKDAAGVFALNCIGAKTMVLTGRECFATERRMKELKVDYIFQNIKDKKRFLLDFLKKENVKLTEVAYIGDDVNDLSVMHMCGYKACPMDACNEIKSIADYISIKNGGNGAVRDIVENYLLNKELWSEAINTIYLNGN